MGVSAQTWNGAAVCKWLERRIEATARDQAAADKRGYEAQEDYDKAAAEEWVCRSLRAVAEKGDQAEFAARLKQLLGQDEYRIAGIHDVRRVERHIRANLRKITKMTKANEGFENLLHHQ